MGPGDSTAHQQIFQEKKKVGQGSGGITTKELIQENLPFENLQVKGPTSTQNNE